MRPSYAASDARHFLQRSTPVLLAHLCLWVFFVFVPAQAVSAGDPESSLARELAEAVAESLPANARIMLVVPPAAASPVPVDDIESIMTRIATRMAVRLDQPVEILAGGREVREALRGVMHRQGLDGWKNAVQQLVRNDETGATHTLIGDVGSESGRLVLRMSLVSLEGGTVLASTSAVELDRPAARLGAPDAAIAEAIEGLMRAAPEATSELTVIPFVLDRSGLSGQIGEYLARIAARAWTDLVSGPDRLLREAPPARLIMQPSAGLSFNLSGRIWVIDRSSIRLLLNLTDGEALLASRFLDLSTSGLPSEILAVLNPARPSEGSGFAPVRALGRLGPGWLQMEMQGGPTPIYRVCPGDGSSDTGNCDLLRFTLKSDAAGSPMCFALGDDLSFGMLIPNDYANTLRLQSGQPVVVPDELSLRNGSAQRIVWPAYGPPSPTLVKCLLYPSDEGIPVRELSAWSGLVLNGEQVERLSLLLKDSEPVASASSTVQIVDRDRPFQARR